MSEPAVTRADLLLLHRFNELPGWERRAVLRDLELRALKWQKGVSDDELLAKGYPVAPSCDAPYQLRHPYAPPQSS